MKLPGPDHPITITANPRRVRVTADGVVIAETTHALTLKEASYPAVQYVPRQDAKMELLKRTERVTHCPYKGNANYFSVTANGKMLSPYLDEGLKKWQALPEAERTQLDAIGAFDPAKEPAPPPGGLILQVYARALVRDDAGRFEPYKTEVSRSWEPGRDHVD